ncbi:MAG: prephenate dehydratase [Bacteroidota bacterium]
MEAHLLEELREKIDYIDDQVLALLNDRMRFVKEIGRLKQSSNAVIYRPEREKAILDRLSGTNAGLLNREAIEAIFLEVFAVSRNIELPEKVAFLGPEGSFTHQAAEVRFGAMSEYVGLRSIRSVFESVETGRTRFGVIPLENNQEGVVNETIEMLRESNIKIVAEIPLAIHFAFGTNCENIGDVKRIYSKDIAFKQCKNFLNDFFSDRGIEQIAVESTSKAAKLASEEEGSAAICSHIATKPYNLPILYENIEDSEDNHTRFLIISKDFVNQPSGQDKTSIVAMLSHDGEPGSLVDFLKTFHEKKINLNKIESHPAKHGKGFQYWFFIEFDGHYEDHLVKEIMEANAHRIKWLGSYVKLC